MTRKDYILIAKAIDEATDRDNAWRMKGKKALLSAFSDMLQADNPLFDRGRFETACCAKHSQN